MAFIAHSKHNSANGLVCKLSAFVLFVACLLSITAAASGQQSNSATPAAQAPVNTSTTPQINVNVNLVNVLMTVTNKKKQLVTGLEKKDFELF
ncbi:MAG TPA: hypothetical protein VGY31_17620, partial [Terriglobia bacterium]|nr:hypothetical protein [Terriglobia bacterium]